MRGIRLVQVALFGFAAMALTVAPAGGATVKAESDPDVLEAGFRLPDSHGYRITASAYAIAKGQPGAIQLDVNRAGEHVSYRAPATATEDTLRANLGKIGRVDLTRRRSGRQKTVRLKCIDSKLTYEPATYEGTVEFKGEEGYASARATRLAFVPPWLLLANAGLCGSSGFGESIGVGVPGARLRGVSYANGRVLEFQVNKNSQKSRVLFSASLKERHNRLRVVRSVGGTVPPDVFRFHPSLRSATLGRRSPFSGVGTLRRSPTSYLPRLAGDLALDFPGRSAVRLTGPDVHVSLAHARFNRSRGPHAEVQLGHAP